MSLMRRKSFFINFPVFPYPAENQTTGLRPMEMHPYPRLRRYFPRRGKSALHSAFVLISISKHSAAKICPSGEEAAAGGRRGAFPRAKGAVVWFSPPVRAVVKVLSKLAPSIILKAPPLSPFGDISPRESVSHDSQSPAALYESCSLATPLISKGRL